MVEIERKFLVLSQAFKEEATSQKKIMQGYLNTDPERTVRVRTKGDKAFITIKGKGNDTGTTRMEWEKEISSEDALQLLAICEKGMIDKMRYEVKAGSHLFEIDEFYGDNKGLTMAEIELSDETELFEKPAWLGKEVTGDERYYNAYLSNNPYTSW